MKAVGWSLSLSFGRTQKNGDKGGARGVKGKKERTEKTVILTLSYCQRWWEGNVGWRVTPCEDREHRAVVKLAQPHKEKTTQALCIHVLYM